jgi:hypothetical protein
MRYLALLPVLALAACSSSGGGDSRPSLEELDQIQAMPEMDASDMPITGSADFAGVMDFEFVEDDDDFETTADLDLSVDFADGEVTGTASNFRSDEVGELQGEAAMGGSVDGASLGGNMEGRLSGVVDGEDFSAFLDVNLFGNFVADTPADGPDGVVGGVEGFVEVEGSDVAQPVGGGFVAIRQD